MTTALLSALKKAQMKYPIEVQRRFSEDQITGGFVVDFTDSLILFHNLDMDTFCLNGYTVILTKDITRHRVFNKADYWRERAIRHFGVKPIKPAGISLASLPQMLKTVSEHFPLIAFHPEEKKPEVCYIGALTSTTERTLTIEDLNADCEWSGPRRMRFSEVSRIDFGGRYEESLAATAPKKPKRKQ